MVVCLGFGDVMVWFWLFGLVATCLRLGLTFWALVWVFPLLGILVWWLGGWFLWFSVGLVWYEISAFGVVWAYV